MNFGDMCTEVGVLLEDNSEDIVSRIPGAVNEAILYAADKVDIPSLKRLISVTTIANQAWASLPNTSAGKILHVSSSNADGDSIEILSCLEDLLEHSPSLDFEGDVDMVALEGTTLYYQSIPSTPQTLLVLHYAYPETLVREADEPNNFPKSLHRKLFVHGAASILYEFIEDGLEAEDKNNTNWHTNKMNEGISELFAWRAKNRRGKMRHPYSV